MMNPVRASADCQLVAEYVDEAECPANGASCGGEVMRTHVVGNYLDLWSSDEGLKEFTVLLKDGRIVAVRGHGLRHVPHSVAGEDIYDITVRTAGEEVSVALFKCCDVDGIFHGELRSDRRIA
jgi:hypothetical protein